MVSRNDGGWLSDHGSNQSTIEEQCKGYFSVIEWWKLMTFFEKSRSDSRICGADDVSGYYARLQSLDIRAKLFARPDSTALIYHFALIGPAQRFDTRGKKICRLDLKKTQNATKLAKLGSVPALISRDIVDWLIPWLPKAAPESLPGEHRSCKLVREYSSMKAIDIHIRIDI